MKNKVLIVALALLLTAAALAGCSADRDKARTEELIVGAWIVQNDVPSTRTTYMFWPGGKIEQSAVVIDEDGNETDISLGGMFNMTYTVVSGSEIELNGVAFGEDSEPERVSIEFPDDNTMKLGDSLYTRYIAEE